MAEITAIVTAYKDSEGLKYTLEGLVEQSTEDFEVIIVDNGDFSLKTGLINNILLIIVFDKLLWL